MEPIAMNGVDPVHTQQQQPTSLYHIPQHPQSVLPVPLEVVAPVTSQQSTNSTITTATPAPLLNTDSISYEGGDQMVDVKPFANGASTIEPDTATDQTADSLVLSTQAASQILNPGTLLRQINQLGPSERCSPTQAQNMGKQLLTIIAYHEKNNVSLPVELQNSFDILHRCLAVIYGTFFLNLYTKANAPCLLCHSCKCLYPPGQFIHHTCSSLPPNILPCRSRMWRRCLVPLVSPGIDKDLQKQRWKFVLEKFSHNAAMNSRKNHIPPETEAQLLDMPELKRGRFTTKLPQRKGSDSEIRALSSEREKNGDGTGTAEASDSNILDIESSADYSLDEGSPVGDTTAQSTSLSMSPIALAEQVVSEVRRLQKELALTKVKLHSATELIGRMPSEGMHACMREQLAQALSTQQSLTIERDQAREQAKISTERGDRLQRQVDLLRQAHSQMEKHLS